MMTNFVLRGIPFRDDQNGKWEDGVFEMALNVNEKRERVPTALAYLSADVRRRPNLEVRTGLTVERIILEGSRAVGVATRGEDGVVVRTAWKGSHRQLGCAGLPCPADAQRHRSRAPPCRLRHRGPA